MKTTILLLGLALGASTCLLTAQNQNPPPSGGGLRLPPSAGSIELDGEISFYYATAFAQVAKTLTAEQKATLLKLRYLDAKFACTGAYLYSRAIPMPEVRNTDFLFGAGPSASQNQQARN